MQKGVDFIGITVVFFCHDENGNFLMQKRSQNCRDEKGKWDIGAGGLEFGENVFDRLKKEIKEEYSTEIIKYEFLGYRDLHRVDEEGKKTHWLATDFKILIDKNKVKNGEPQKFDKIEWFNLENLPEPELLHSQEIIFFEKYKDKLFS